jgi:iron complex transport system ATP-binding protein
MSTIVEREPDPLVAVDLSAAYDRQRIFSGVSFTLARGTLTALVGPNGCGKTTLLHTLCGIHTEATGEVRLLGRPLHGLDRREVARRVGLVPQFSQIDFGVTVEEAVALGRYPWLGMLAPPAAEDRAAVEAALAALDLAALRRRPLQTLSGGERQRVFLARALAQAAPVLLLDEPAASLDLRYQQETFERLRALARERGAAVLVADHHLNLVAATCDSVIVLTQGVVAAQGPPREIVTEAMIRTVFGARMRVTHDPQGRPQCLWEF